MTLQILDRESTLIQRLRSAIDRANDGCYGICLQCEEEIAPKRLKAIPWAELCIDCRERADDSASRRERIVDFKDHMCRNCLAREGEVRIHGPAACSR